MSQTEVASVNRKRCSLLWAGYDSPGDVVSLFQSTDSLCLTSRSSTEKPSKPVWASILPGAVRAATISARTNMMAAVTDDKCYVSSSSSAFTLDFIPISPGLPSCSVVSFDPSNPAHVAVSTNRDIRVFDVTRNVSDHLTSAKSASALSATGSTSVKPVFTISGAVPQAFPLSFTYHPSFPNIIISGWGLSSASPYIRVVDLREGVSKSVKIWKSQFARNLGCSPVDDRYFSGSYEDEINVFDFRKVFVKQSSDEGIVVRRKWPETTLSKILWSSGKHNTIGVLNTEGVLSSWRTDLDSVGIATQNVEDFCWDPINNNFISIATSGDSSFEIKRCESRSAPSTIPVWNPGCHTMDTFATNRMYPPITHGKSSFLDQTGQMVDRLSENLSLVDVVLDDPILREDVGWAVSEDISSLTELDRRIQEALTDPVEVIRSEHTFEASKAFKVPSVYSSASREFLIRKILLPDTVSDIVLLILTFRFGRPLLQALMEREVDGCEGLVRELTRMELGTQQKFSSSNFLAQINIKISSDSPSKYIREAMLVVGRTVAGASVGSVVADQSVNIFIRGVIALLYLSEDEVRVAWNNFGKECILQHSVSLKHMVFTSSSDVHALVEKYLRNNQSNPLPVVVLSVLLRESLSDGCVAAVRELCNQKKGNFWCLRSVIDSVLGARDVETSTSTMICYYCSKPLTGVIDNQFPSMLETFSSGSEVIVNRCPHRGCHKSLPSCCVCLEPLKISLSPTVAVAADEWVVFCGTCRHGGHRSHLTEWFTDFDECPVAGCNCQCNNVDGCD